MAKNTDSKATSLTGCLDAHELTIESDAVKYSLKDKLLEYDGLEVTVTIKATKELAPLSD